MMTANTIARTTLVLLLAAGTETEARAGSVPFTLDLSKAIPALPATPFTADSISTTDFLLNVAPPVGEATDTFIMRIDGFSLNGSAVAVPGLNSSFGLYFSGTLALHAVGSVSVYDSGTISLMADPTNNDGTLSTTFDPAALKGGVNFSSPAGTATDVTLATGSLLSATFGPQSNGNVGLHLLETFSANPAEAGVLVSPNSIYTMLDAFFFNTATSRMGGTSSDGGSYVIVNDGFGVFDVAVPEPATLGLLGTGLVGLLALRRRSPPSRGR